MGRGGGTEGVEKNREKGRVAGKEGGVYQQFNDDDNWGMGREGGLER